MKIIDCECDGKTCCGGEGIAVFSIIRDGKRMRVCTKCDLSMDKENKRILPYVKRLSHIKLDDFDSLGATCLWIYIKDKEFEFDSKN